MKLQALVAAVALAFGASAFAQTATPATPAMPATPAAKDTDPAKAKDTAKADDTKDTRKSSAKAKSKKKSTARKAKDTRTMGMGPASPVTDLDAPQRQARIDQAYANWQAMQRR